MPQGEYYDSLETRAPEAREKALMTALTEQVANAKPHDEKSWEILFGKKQFEKR